MTRNAPHERDTKTLSRRSSDYNTFPTTPSRKRNAGSLCT